jgi:hypothetical protein
MMVQELIDSANESALGFVTSVQDTVLDANRAVASAVARIVPDPPSWLPNLDTPDVKKLVENGYAVQAKLLEKQTAFAVGLVDAWTPAKAETTKKPAAAKQ